MLTDQRHLPKTSSTPGKTQLINHFKINDNWFLVDLPGYGYARVSKKQRKTFQSYIKDYFIKRDQLICSFVLIDIRHKPQPIDLDFMTFLAENEIAFCIVFTKSDKLKPQVIQKNIEQYKTEMLAGDWAWFPEYFVTSSSKKKGKEELLSFIDTLNNSFYKKQ